jgi:signal transduction histidine kinase
MYVARPMTGRRCAGTVDMMDRRPSRTLLEDSLIAAALAGLLMLATAQLVGLTPVRAAALVVLSAPLVLRRPRPMLTLVLTLILVFPALVVVPDHVLVIGAVPMLALFTMAERGSRTLALAIGVALVPIGLLTTALRSDGTLLRVETLKTLAIVALPVAIGMAVRDRRAFVEAMRERAERAEASREEEALRRVGEERLRIARELHDVVAHAMVAINVQAGVAAHLIDRDPGTAHRSLAEIKRVSGEALTDLRSTLGVLREPRDAAPTRPAGTLAAVPDLVQSVRAAGLDVTLTLEIAAAPPLPTAVEGAAYRILQEALTNVLRHAPAAGRVVVAVALRGEGLEVEVVDDGDGGAAPHPGSGNGLRGMHERAEVLGGTVRSGPREAGGWAVSAQLPVAVGAPVA